MKLLEAALKLLVTITHKAAGSSSQALQQSQSFCRRPGASCSSPETSCSIHSAVDASGGNFEGFSSSPNGFRRSSNFSSSIFKASYSSCPDSSYSTRRSIGELLKIKRDLDLLELQNYDLHYVENYLFYVLLGIKLARQQTEQKIFQSMILNFDFNYSQPNRLTTYLQSTIHLLILAIY